MQSPIPADPPSATFTHRELARLAAYKAAVEVGFYTDACADPPDLEWNGRGYISVCGQLLEAYPFTQAERARLAVYKAAIEAGLYSDV